MKYSSPSPLCTIAFSQLHQQRWWWYDDDACRFEEYCSYSSTNYEISLCGLEV